MTCPRMMSWTGLSPRLRGNLNVLGAGPASVGSIPAPAGEPQNQQMALSLRWVYPRACGGTWGNIQSGTITAGLSPRLRGNLQPLHPGSVAVRSIPAPAGEPNKGVDTVDK